MFTNWNITHESYQGAQNKSSFRLDVLQLRSHHTQRAVNPLVYRWRVAADASPPHSAPRRLDTSARSASHPRGLSARARQRTWGSADSQRCYHWSVKSLKSYFIWWMFFIIIVGKCWGLSAASREVCPLKLRIRLTQSEQSHLQTSFLCVYTRASGSFLQITDLL